MGNINTYHLISDGSVIATLTTWLDGNVITATITPTDDMPSDHPLALCRPDNMGIGHGLQTAVWDCLSANGVAELSATRDRPYILDMIFERYGCTVAPDENR